MNKLLLLLFVCVSSISAEFNGVSGITITQLEKDRVVEVVTLTNQQYIEELLTLLLQKYPGIEKDFKYECNDCELVMLLKHRVKEKVS